jgi:hypothetical protein
MMMQGSECFFTFASAPRLWFLVVLDRSKGGRSTVATEAAGWGPEDFLGQRIPDVGRAEDAVIIEAHCRAALAGECRRLETTGRRTRTGSGPSCSCPCPTSGAPWSAAC